MIHEMEMIMESIVEIIRTAKTQIIDPRSIINRVGSRI
jgi:hypothetical protein